jgi:hypothetical protein
MHRVPTEEARERLLRPKGKTSEATREEISKLSAAYLEARNSKLRAQAFMAEAQAKEKAGGANQQGTGHPSGSIPPHLPEAIRPQLPHEIRSRDGRPG